MMDHATRHLDRSKLESPLLYTDEDVCLIEQGDRPVSERSKSKRCLPIFHTTGKALLVAFAVVGVFNTASYVSQMFWDRSVARYQPSYDDHYAVKYVNEPCDCGSTVEEAISRGCVYDQLSSGWLPEHCRDDELTDEFSQLGDGPDGNWQYWADTEHTQPLTLDEVAHYADIQPENFHMSYEWHLHHCFFLWRKEHRMKAVGKVYDPKSDSEHHILHCIKMITERSNGTAAGATLVG